MKPETIFKFGTFENVNLSMAELGKLKEQFGINEAQERIDAFSEQIKAKGYKYVSHYAAIISWARRDAKRNGNQRVDNKYVRFMKGR